MTHRRGHPVVLVTLMILALAAMATIAAEKNGGAAAATIAAERNSPGSAIASERNGVSSAAAEPSLVRIPLKGKRLLRQLEQRRIEIIAFNRDGTIDVVASDRQIDWLFSLGIGVSVIATPDMETSKVDLTGNLGGYHTYIEMEGELNVLALNYPSLTDLQVMGTSLEGRNIYVIKISDNAAVDESEAEVIIMGNLHARELMAVEIPLMFAQYLLQNYGTDPVVTHLVDNREIFIAPMLNPDGHVYVENNNAGSWWTWWRKNRRLNPLGSMGVDLNRNFGYNWGLDNLGSSPTETSQTYRGTGPFSEPETQAIRTFFGSRQFTVGLSYHSYGELLLFPWGYDFLYTADHAVFMGLGNALASGTGYLVGNPAMGAIYLVNGDTDDWAYGDNIDKPAMFMYTPEVNTQAQGGFGPIDTWIQPTFDLVLDMNMKAVELAENPYSVVGPYTPTLFAIDASWNPNFVLSWSANNPSDPNPVADYDIIEYKNRSTIGQDSADSASPLWIFDGFSSSSARAFEGTGSYYSGALNNASRTLEMETFYSVTTATETFTSMIWYNIEQDWDYAYLEVSTDGGLIWHSVPGNITTNTNPNGNNRGNGITGASPGWVLASFPLTAYLNTDVMLRWNYVTDASVLGEGIYVDLPGPVWMYESKSVIASQLIGGTTYVVAPTELGEFTYQVRARDAAGDLSNWSAAATQSVTILTGIGDTTPLATRLGPNYPNPFNPVTQIPYTVGNARGAAQGASVRLDIYNVAGERIATLVNRDVPPGIYQATWHGKTDTGAVAPSGIYFARLRVGGEQTFTRKLVMLK